MLPHPQVFYLQISLYKEPRSLESGGDVVLGLGLAPVLIYTSNLSISTLHFLPFRFMTLGDCLKINSVGQTTAGKTDARRLTNSVFLFPFHIISIFSKPALLLRIGSLSVPNAPLKQHWTNRAIMSEKNQRRSRKPGWVQCNWNSRSMDLSKLWGSGKVWDGCILEKREGGCGVRRLHCC